MGIGQEISLITPYIVLPIEGILVEENSTSFLIEDRDGGIFILKKNENILTTGGSSGLQF